MVKKNPWNEARLTQSGGFLVVKSPWCREWRIRIWRAINRDRGPLPLGAYFLVDADIEEDRPVYFYLFTGEKRFMREIVRVLLFSDGQSWVFNGGSISSVIWSLSINPTAKSLDVSVERR